MCNIIAAKEVGMQRRRKIMMLCLAVITLVLCVFSGVKVMRLQKENGLLCDHEYGKGIITQEPTCEKAGEKTWYCQLCGNRKIEILSPNGHKEEVIKGEEPTCERDGISNGVMCVECNKVLKSQEVIKALGHDYKQETAIPLSCMEDGKVNYICGNCGKVILETLEAKGHTFVDGECKECNEKITVKELRLLKDTTLNYNGARPVFTFSMQAPLSLQQSLTNEEELGGILVSVADLKEIGSVKATTDWVKELERLGKQYRYKKLRIEADKGSFVSDGIAYEEMTEEFTVIPCIKTQTDRIISYRYSVNFSEVYEEYSTSVAYLAGNELNRYAVGEKAYTQRELINLNNYIDEIVDYISGEPVPIYDGSFFDFGENEEDEIEIDIIETGNEVLSIPFFFKTRIGFLWGMENSETQFGISESDGSGISITTDGFKVEKGLQIYLFGKKLTIGINIKSESKGAGTR